MKILEIGGIDLLLLSDEECKNNIEQLSQFFKTISSTIFLFKVEEKNNRYITTKDLKDLFGLSINDYVYNGKFNRADFERKTIKLALLEINKITNIVIEFKKVRKVIKFWIMNLFELKKKKIK